MTYEKETKNKFSRRDFIKTVAVGFGATAVPGIGAMNADAQAPSKWDFEADVVVVGSGAVGLPAAIRARDEGASVIVVEANWEIGGKATGILAHYTPTIPPGSTTPMKSFRSAGNIAPTMPAVSVRARKAVVIATGGGLQPGLGRCICQDFIVGRLAAIEAPSP